MVDDGYNQVVLCHPSERRRVCDRRRLVAGLLTLGAVVLFAELFWTINERHPFAWLIGLVLVGLAFVAYLIDVAEVGVRWFFVARRARRSSLVWKREGDLFSMTAQRGEHRAVSDIPVGGFCRWDRVPDDRPNFGGSIVFMLGDDERPFATQWFDDNLLIRRFIDDLIGAGVVIGPPVVIDRVPDRSVWPLKFASRRETMLLGALLVPMVIWRWIIYFLGIGA